MGSPPDDRDRDENEGPQHRVRIAPGIALGVTEVTVGEWQDCLADGGCNAYQLPQSIGFNERSQSDPMEFVSWDDAQAYVAWLSKKTSKDYRLPSEAEWEYAARAGSSTVQYGWRGFKPSPNPFGVYKLNQSQAEWVEDCWHHRYFTSLGARAPSDGSAWTSGPGTDCSMRVVHGGGPLTRVAHREPANGTVRRMDASFRVARNLGPAEQD